MEKDDSGMHAYVVVKASPKREGNSVARGVWYVSLKDYGSLLYITSWIHEAVVEAMSPTV
jgi:hypothetical protein